MGLTKQRLGSVLNSAQSSANNCKFHKFLLVKNYLKELVAHFLLDNSSKRFFSEGFNAKHSWEIYLPGCVFDTECNLTRLSFLSSRTY